MRRDAPFLALRVLDATEAIAPEHVLHGHNDRGAESRGCPTARGSTAAMGRRAAAVGERLHSRQNFARSGFVWQQAAQLMASSHTRDSSWRNDLLRRGSPSDIGWGRGRGPSCGIRWRAPDVEVRQPTGGGRRRERRLQILNTCQAKAELKSASARAEATHWLRSNSPPDPVCGGPRTRIREAAPGAFPPSRDARTRG